MPEYSIKTVADISKVIFECPFCYKNYKTKGAIRNHIPNCTDNSEAPDEAFDEIYLMENYTVSDYINERERLVKTIRKFIQTNELAAIADQTGEQIRKYISDRLAIDHDSLFYTWEIYMFFFVLSKEERELAEKEQVREMNFKYGTLY